MRKGITWTQLKESKKDIYNRGIRRSNWGNNDSLIEDRITIAKRKSLMILYYLKQYEKI